MKHILITVIFLAVLVLVYWCVSSPYRGRYYKDGYAAGYAYIKSIKELQEQVGAEPDGIWGKDTNSLYDRAWCNQAAIKMFKKMSKK